MLGVERLSYRAAIGVGGEAQVALAELKEPQQLLLCLPCAARAA